MVVAQSLAGTGNDCLVVRLNLIAGLLSGR